MTNGLGCLPSKIDIRDYTICSSANPNIIYPEKFELQDLPKVKFQSSINSCCAHATSSILEYYDKNRHNLSTNFIYGIQKKLFNRHQMGMYLKDACEIALKYGDMLEENCKGNDEIPKCYAIAERALEDGKAVEQAYKFRIDSYYLCQSDKDIKYALMNYGPVLGGMMWYEDFALDKESIIHFDKNSRKNGHAVTVIGFDNTKGKRGCWRIQNSWGTQFGDNGCFWLPYEDGLFEARCLVDYPNEDVVLQKSTSTTPRWLAKICNFLLNIFSIRG